MFEALVFLLSIGALVWIWRGGEMSPGVTDRATVIAAIFGVMAVVVGVRAGFDVARNWRRELRVTDADLAVGSDLLANATLAYWRDQARTRGITAPIPAAVKWRWSAGDLAAPPGDIGLDGEAAAEGVVTTIGEHLYEHLPAGRPRLVITGPAGSGKTGTMLMLLVHVLETRADDRAAVPVWLSMSGWDVRLPLRRWVIDRLERDYPALFSSDLGGRPMVEELFDRGRLALFLDGFDEMPAASRPAAFRQLEEVEGVRLVITSRPAELRAALAGRRLFGAAVVQTMPIEQAEAASFLIRGQAGQQRDHWAQVGRHLVESPNSALARTFTTPLALSLARDAYRSDGDPRELLARDQRESPEELLAFLLTRFFHFSYPDPKQRARAITWLRWLAIRMGPDRDLAWWQIVRTPWPVRTPRGLPRPDRSTDDEFSRHVDRAIALNLEPATPRPTPRGLRRGDPLLRVRVGGLCIYLVLAVFALRAAQLQMLEPERIMARILQEPVPPLSPVAFAMYAVIAAVIGAGVAILLTFATTLAVVDRSIRLEAATPATSFAADLRFGWRWALAFLAVGAVLVLPLGLRSAVAFALGGCLGALAGPALSVIVLQATLFCRGKGWVSFLSFLEDANHRQVLRQVGPLYQFRHAALQEYLVAFDVDRTVRRTA